PIPQPRAPPTHPNLIPNPPPFPPLNPQNSEPPPFLPSTSGINPFPPPPYPLLLLSHTYISAHLSNNPSTFGIGRLTLFLTPAHTSTAA
ncbi:hypothetical protein COCCADRAFT_90848, partial [Bipolaris zeicola 26-R-13]